MVNNNPPKDNTAAPKPTQGSSQGAEALTAQGHEADNLSEIKAFDYAFEAGYTKGYRAGKLARTRGKNESA